jgi:phenol hydroxylase P0 protein
VPFNQLPQRRPAFDATRRYVRFRELRSDGYVLFDFAIGDPEIAVELMLTLPDYQEFCRTNAVTWLTRAQADAVDIENSKWRFGVPGLPT